jgi:hypothetical protein
LSSVPDATTVAAMEKKEPIEETALLGALADLIRAARTLSKHVSAKEASELGKLMDQAHTILNGLLSKHGEGTKKLD